MLPDVTIIPILKMKIKQVLRVIKGKLGWMMVCE